MRDRSFLLNYLMYVGVISVALMGLALVLMGAGLTGVPSGLTATMSNPSDAGTGPSQREKTYLEIRMEDLREIKQALAKPLPSPEPLSPVTARANHAAANVRVAKAASSISQRQKLIAEARRAMEAIEPAASETRLNAYAEIDRHTLH